MHMDESFHYKTPVVMPRQGICRQRDSAADLVPHSHLEDAAALPRVQHEVPPPQQDTIAAASAVSAQTKQDTAGALAVGAQSQQDTAGTSAMVHGVSRIVQPLQMLVHILNMTLL
ncbi:hypothetical protein LWI29_029748 [Acer saccharum]|uniref:Uncharacterized protein n=1 Tax=Acer saccharum TaxID=4024 RepID=A0AA39W3A4_ACESA|nr:hypothetical protein LWI29_029748 [Acer saccharum]